jgi:hypothetical protein
MLPAYKSVPVRPRGLCTLVCVASLSAGVAADPLPEDVRACAAVTDPAERLACYDREAAHASKPSSPSGAQASGEPVQERASASAPPQGPAAAPDARARERKTSQGSDATPSSFTAHVISIEHAQAGLLLHLDNGQIWQEVQPVAGDLSLRLGDTVQIQKRLGSFWLKGPHVYAMNIRRK